MRWFASLVVLCLLAGSDVRPRVEVRSEPTSPQIESTEGLPPMVAARRDGAVAPELRLASFVITPAAPAILPPTRTAVLLRLGPITRPTLAAGRAYAARGPPRA